MKRPPPLLDRDALRAFLARKKLLPVRAAREGRFIIPVPDFGDRKGPVLMPNVKELEARLRGSEGRVTSIELEAGPQSIPADGTNVIVINRVDEFVQKALSAKLEHLIDSARGVMTRAVLEEFIGYARGYTYAPKTRKISFAPNAGFRNDVYNMTNAELKKRYVLFSRPDISLEDYDDRRLRAGYYIKKPLDSRGAWLSGPFRVRVAEAAGGTLQEFSQGAMVNVPGDMSLPLSFIHETDINTCYTRRDGGSLVDARGRHGLPVIEIAKLRKR